MPNSIQCKLVPYPGMHAASPWSMTALHRTQAGIDDTVEAIVAVRVFNGTLNYSAKIGRAPKPLIQLLNNSAVPIVLIPCAHAALFPDQRAVTYALTATGIEDYASKLGKIISIAAEATITPTSDIFAGESYNVPGQETTQE